MEKLKPTYLLAFIKASFANAEAGLAITSRALLDADALDLDAYGIAGCIQSIEAKHFYKSMTTDRDSRVWQDVYHVPWGGVVLYVKFMQNEDGRLYLMSFKIK